MQCSHGKRKRFKKKSTETSDRDVQVSHQAVVTSQTPSKEKRRTLARMQECYQVVFPGQKPVIKKGHIEPIDISVASRGSNKKVTLIKNLEVYGLDPAVIAAALQRRVQASTVIQPVPGTKDKALVQIQGNQVHQAGNLLLDHYQIPRKYIQGLDKAPKGGKKK